MRALIVRPFGVKQGIDFDAVETSLVQPALAAVSLTSSTTGELTSTGTIREDILHQLVLADVVIADCSIQNANVFYELGVRHALRSRTTVLIRAALDAVPFDLVTSRYLVYDHRNPSASIAALVSLLAETMVSNWTDSPVYLSLPRLVPPTSTDLMAVPQSFREAVEAAAQKRHVGDLRLFADEIGSLDWAAEGLRTIGIAQFRLAAWDAARETFEALRRINTDDVETNLRLGTVYQRLGDLARSSSCIERVAASPQATANDRSEALALHGRNEKNLWRDEFQALSGDAARTAALKSVHLAEAINRYANAFENNLHHYYSGLSALSLQRVRNDLSDSLSSVWLDQFDDDLEATRQRQAGIARFEQLAAAVHLSLKAAGAAGQRTGTEDEVGRIWLAVSEADHAFLTATSSRGVARRYIQALARAPRFAIESARAQIELFQHLNLRNEIVAEVMPALEELLLKSSPDYDRGSSAADRPRASLFFVGHQIDQVGRPVPRFSANAEQAARELIRAAVERERIATDGSLVGLASGSPGGDILFHEVCHELGIPTELFLPIPAREFAAAAVAYAGTAWLDRFDALCERLTPKVLSDNSELPSWLRAVPAYSVWQRVGRWLQFNALSSPSATLIALWDQRRSGERGGVADLVEEARRRELKSVVLSAEGLASFAVETEATPRVTPALASLPPLKPPAELVAALARRSVVPVVGAGFSAQAGLPVWRDLFGHLVKYASQTVIDAKTAETLERALALGQYEEVGKRLVHSLSRPVLASQLNGALGGDRAAHPSEAHRILADLPLGPILTFNLDSLLEQSLSLPATRVFTRLSAERGLDALSRGDKFLLKLSGALQEPDSLLISVTQHVEEASLNRPFKELIDRLALNRTFLFLGMSMEGINDFMRTFQLRARSNQRHFAVIRVSDDTWELAALNLRDRYGIETLAFAETTQSTALVHFLTALRSETAVAASTLPVDAVREAPTTKLRSLLLENIGPFDQLSLEFDPGWNCLLGDNGVGKSTILKSIAVALGGDDAVTFAERILRKGSTRGEIALVTTAGTTYRTVITARTGGGVELTRPDGVPDPGWLAVGFPALRTTTWRPVAREGMTIANRPNAQDLMPLLADEPDPRLDALKQRIVALDHWIQRTEQSPDVERYRALVDKFFEVTASVARGVGIKGYTVDPLSGRVLVKTHTNSIPMESLSQGTISLTSLIGVLLLRLYDVTPQGEDPLCRYALALIDEIDAHMHPAWQRTITTELSTIFGNVQFIVTTHSPLVVGGMRVEQVYRLRRGDDAAIVVERPQQSLQGLGVAGLLTSDLFELDTHLDVPTQNALARKRALLAQEQLNDAEAEELGTLDEQLGNIDYTKVVRDPLYHRFVAAIGKVETEREVDEPLTEAERVKKEQVAEEILRELLQEESGA